MEGEAAGQDGAGAVLQLLAQGCAMDEIPGTSGSTSGSSSEPPSQDPHPYPSPDASYPPPAGEGNPVGAVVLFSLFSRGGGIGGREKRVGVMRVLGGGPRGKVSA